MTKLARHVKANVICQVKLFRLAVLEQVNGYTKKLYEKKRKETAVSDLEKYFRLKAPSRPYPPTDSKNETSPQ